MPVRTLIGASFIAVFLSVTSVYSSNYVVQKNDSVWSIAKKFNSRVELIIKINDLPNNRLKIGQKLVIPEQVMVYTVKNGDNLTKIASENHSKLPYIILANNLPDEKIYPGMKINIPVTEGTPRAKVNPVIKNTPSTLYVKRRVSWHKVIKGDTLTSLSEQFNVSISEIMDWNRKKNASIYIGEKLKIYSDAQERKDEVIARTEIEKEVAQKSNLRMNNPGSFEFPMDYGRIDRLSRSGRGIIVYMETGTDILSIQNGVVEYAGKMTGYNSVVIVNYGNDERAIYGFLNDVRVKEGDAVNKRQPIGSVSQATYLGQIQFYFELRKGKENINALDVFPTLKNRDYFAKN